MTLINSIEEEIEKLDHTVNLVSIDLSSSNEKQSVDSVLSSMRNLLLKIEQSIPFLQLSISTSGIQATGSLPSQVSPGRLLQASNEISKASLKSGSRVAIGPAFDCILYSIFYNPSRLKYVDESLTSAISWKEDFARATTQLYKTSEYDYELEIFENFDDNRYHEDDVKPRKHIISILDISRLFFSASGKLLKLEGNSSPVLILKLSKEGESWISFGETGLRFDDQSDNEDESDEEDDEGEEDEVTATKETSLSLLEYLIRLLSLQKNDRKSIFEATDERLALYLKDENYVLNTQHLKGKQDSKNEESLTLDSNIKRLENLKIQNNN